MYEVRTDHQIVAFGTELMRLYDRDGTVIVTATRDGDWVITAGGADDTTAETRAQAITAMIDTALKVLPGGGYSTLVPRGLEDTP